MRLALVALTIWGSAKGLAHEPTRIAFIEFKNQDGGTIALTPGGRFGHLALSYKGRWLHAHPYGGVRLISFEELQRTGTVSEIVSLPEGLKVDEALVQKFLGRAYDAEFSWNDEKLYCSELIAKVLHLPPSTMTFATPYWDSHPPGSTGAPGISPDEIFLRLHRPVCSKLFI